MGSCLYHKRLKAEKTIRTLIKAIRALGYDEDSSVEIVECLLEDAKKDGIDAEMFWGALETVSPLKIDV